MADYILAHDLGTSGNKATLYDISGKLTDAITCSYATMYPFNGAVEQNPESWWKAVCFSTGELMSRNHLRKGDIACVSFSGMMMGCLLVDNNGTPLRDMLIWADTRSSKQESDMLKRVPMERVYRITGHRASASYSAAKLLWIKDNESEIYRKAYKMINAKDYMIFKLTGNIVTDYSDASSTNLLDITKKEWSGELLDSWGISADLLPELHASTDIAGTVTKDAARQTGLAEGTPVVIGGGDGSCSCVGAGAVTEGLAYNAIGTSSWISMATKEPIFDEKMRTFNFVHLDNNLYTPCGTMQAAGCSYSWYRDTLCRQEKEEADKLGINAYVLMDEQIKNSPPGANGMLYLPYLLGERSPHWNINSRGAFIGIDISTQKCDFTRAVLEGVGFNLKTILNIFCDFTDIQSLNVVGGGAKGKAWLQILADIWQKPLYVPMYLEEATSIGAAVCGGIGVQAFNDFSVIKKFNSIQSEVRPNPDNAKVYEKLYQSFVHAYEQLIPIYDELAIQKSSNNKMGCSKIV